MTTPEHHAGRVSLEEIDEKIAIARRTLSRVNGMNGLVVTEPKLQAILEILSDLTDEVRRIRDHLGAPLTD